jgi:hypothetical protein
LYKKSKFVYNLACFPCSFVGQIKDKSREIDLAKKSVLREDESTWSIKEYDSGKLRELWFYCYQKFFHFELGTKRKSLLIFALRRAWEDHWEQRILIFFLTTFGIVTFKYFNLCARIIERIRIGFFSLTEKNTQTQLAASV